MAELADILSLDWVSTPMPDGFTPLDAVVLVKGVYETDDGDYTRPVWWHRWTVPLARNPAERLGALEIAARMTLEETLGDYERDD